MPLEYQDYSPFGRRSYQVAGGVLSAKGSGFGTADFEVTFELRTLDPNFDRLRLIDPMLFPMCFVALLGIVGAAVLAEFSQKPGVSWAHGLCLTLGFVGILFSLLSLRRIPAARLKNSAGVAVLDIFRAGPRRESFESFISELQQSIRDAKKG